MFMEAANLLAFLSQIAYTGHVVLQKLKFNKSHLSMPMVTRRHFITISISPERQPGSKGKDTGGSCLPCSSSGATHR